MNKQKHYLNLAILLMAGLVIAGCQEDEVGGFTPAAPGDAIEFAVNAVKTRTAYVSDNQIDWIGGEKIRIYSDVADKKNQLGETVTPGTAEGWKNNALYTVTPVTGDGEHQYHGEFTATNGEYLAWSALSDTHEFYGIYPDERLNIEESTPSNGSFQLQYITNQKCKVTTEDNNYYIAEPDMLNAYMVAHNTVERTKNHVLLDFDPIMTTLDITIKAGGYEVATGIIQPLTVTGVSVTLPVVLGKDYFTYNATNITNSNEEGSQGQGKLQEELGDGSESVFISFTDESGNPMNISLSEGDSIKLTAFLPPIPNDNTTGTKIRVWTAENFNFQTTLKQQLQAQYKIEIPLPDVKPDSPKNTNWISQLDGNIKLTELSIPGYYCNGSENGAVINELLQKGIRVFDIQKLSGWNHKEQMESVVEALNTFIDENPNEFIFTTVDDKGSSPDGLKTPTVNFDKDNWKTTTIAQLRGQIIALYFYNNLLGTSGYVQTDKGIGAAFNHCTFDRESGFKNGDILNNTNWYLRYNDDVHDYSSSQSRYKEIVNCTEQKDRCTGILMVPYANQTYVDGKYTYSDLLIQSIIECNFKFILDRN